MIRSVVTCLLVGIACAAMARADPPSAPHAAHAPQAPGPAPLGPHVGPPAVIDVNKPRSPFDCELPIGVNWYGSRERCLAYLCGDKNVYNEFIFDQDHRRRRNPCYGQSPTNFPDE